MAIPQKIRGLYVIIDPDACRDRSPVDVARHALDGGATVLQWRDKRRDKGDQIADARAIAELCSERGAVLIINDHADLVAATGAHGVHLGQHDLPLVAARKILGPDPIIGVSTNNADEARAAEAAGASYIAVGAIFPTESKNDTRPASLDRIREVKAAVSVPVVAIGGINATNIAEVVGAGADAAAVISAVCGADDVSAAAASLASALEERTPAQRRRELRAIVKEFVDTLNRRDRAGFIALFASDGVIQDPVDQPPHIGHEGIGLWWDALVNVQDNYHVQLDTTHITGEEAAITWTISHRHSDEMHFARGVEILSFDGNLIASCHSYWSREQASHTAMQSLVENYVRALNNRDKSAYLALFAEDAIQQEPVGNMPRMGLAAISAWWDEKMSAYSSYRLKANLVCIAGAETAVAWNLATELDGATFGADGVDMLTIDDGGRIVSVHSYWEVDEQWPTSLRKASADSSQLSIAHRFIDVVNSRDRADFLAMFVDDCVAQVPYHDAPFIGIEGLGRWWDHAMPDSRHDLRLDRAHAVRDEIAVVWTDLDQSPGTITAPRGIEVLTSDEGRLSAVTSYRPLREVDDQRPYAMAEAYVAAVNSRDRDAYLALWSEHGMRQDPPDMIPVIGINALGQAFDQMALRFPNHSVNIETICVAVNEAAIATRVESNDGTTPSLGGVIVIALDGDGKIASLHGYWEAGDVVQGVLAQPPNQHEIRQVVIRLIEILNSRDRDSFLNLVTDDCVIQIPARTEPFVGRPGATQWWDTTIPLLDLKLRLDAMHVVGNDVVIVWSNHNRPPGSTSAVRGIDLLTIEGDRLSEVSAFRTPVDGEYSRQVAVAQAFTDALNARDREAFLSLWAKDAVRQDPPDMIPIIGLEAIGEAFDEMLVQFPDYTMSIETVCVSGNEAAIAWRTENRAGNAPPVVAGVVIIELDAEGKIAALHAYWDSSDPLSVPLDQFDKTRQPELLVMRLLDAFNRRDRRSFRSLFAPDCVIEAPTYVQPFIGEQGVDAWWNEAANEPGLQIQLDAVHVARDELAIVWSSWKGRTGSTGAGRGIDILTLEGDQICAASAFRTLPNEPDPRPRAAAHALIDALNARDRDAYLRLWAKVGLLQDPPTREPIIGIDAIAESFDTLLGLFPDFATDIDTICVAANEAAIAWQTAIRDRGALTTKRGVAVIALDNDGKIASLHSYWEP